MSQQAAKLSVLFLCTGNSCRSQMAVGWARQLKAESIETYSAGVETHGMSPNAVKVMAEAGVDITRQHSKHVNELKDVNLDYVVTVCPHADESCPALPLSTRVVHVAFDDPPKLARGAKSEDEALGYYRRVRDEIRKFIETRQTLFPACRQVAQVPEWTTVNRSLEYRLHTKSDRRRAVRASGNLMEKRMKRLVSMLVLATGVFLGGCKDDSGKKAGGDGAGAEVLKVNGSTTVNLPAAEAAEILRAEKGMKIQVDTQGGSSGGISMLAEGLVQIGMSSKPVSDDDRAKYPKVTFNEIHVGEDGVAVIVSKDVWDGGVHAVTKQQLKDIYESKVTNWKDIGGPDLRIAFFNKEPGRGTWEVFVHWVYGGPKLAPPVSFPEVGGNEETRNKVSSTKGGMSQLSSSWADGKTVFALGIKLDDGTVIDPTPENIATHKYPLSRPLFLLTNGQPTGNVKVYVDFLLSEQGQALVRKHGYLSLDQLKVK